MSSPVRLQRPSNLSLDAPKPKSVTFNEATLTPETHTTASTTSPRKFRCDSEFRAKRQRAHSCSFAWDNFSNKRRKYGGGAIVLPSKFLLGGNITDPLNLEALDKGDTNKATDDGLTGSYRRGGTVRVIIPPNINDPLNLDACSEDGDTQLADAISRSRRRRKPRKRKRRNSEPGGLQCDCVGSSRLCTSLDDSHSPRNDHPIQPPSVSRPAPKRAEAASTSEAAAPTTTLVTATITSTPVPTLASTPVLLRGVSDPGVVLHSEEVLSPVISNPLPRHLPAKKNRTKSENKIVSPVVPQPGIDRKPRYFPHQRHPQGDKPPTSMPRGSGQSKNACFQYGNYNQYYGYRNMGHKTDPRFKFLKKEWFADREILDIGCNIGHISLCIGRDYAPKRVVGIDIDRKLINIAKKNVKHYLETTSSDEETEFPSSMKLLYGPLRPPVNKDGRAKFPHNVRFYQSNYVLENDALLETVRPEFDVVLCLSVTKWVHLNWGDEGLKRFFKRIFRNLKPDGLLILEPQAWPSYRKKRKLTKEISENYKNIRLFPPKFREFLTLEVGFSFPQKGSVPQHHSKGFDRPIYVYKKPCGKSPSHHTPKRAENIVRIPDVSQPVASSSSSSPTANSSSLSQNDHVGDAAQVSSLRLPTASDTKLLKASVINQDRNSTPFDPCVQKDRETSEQSPELTVISTDNQRTGVTPETSASISGVTLETIASSSGVTPERSVSISGVTLETTASSSSATPERSASISGVTPKTSALNTGVTLKTTASSSGVTPERSASISVATPETSALNIGVTLKTTASSSGVTPETSASNTGVTLKTTASSSGATPETSASISGVTLETTASSSDACGDSQTHVNEERTPETCATLSMSPNTRLNIPVIVSAHIDNSEPCKKSSPLPCDTNAPNLDDR